MLFSDIFNPCSYIPDSETKIYLRINGMYFFKDSFIQGVPKKMSFSGKTSITAFKLIQDAKVWGVLENSRYLLQHGHQNFQN